MAKALARLFRSDAVSSFDASNWPLPSSQIGPSIGYLPERVRLFRLRSLQHLDGPRRSHSMRRLSAAEHCAVHGQIMPPRRIITFLGRGASSAQPHYRKSACNGTLVYDPALSCWMILARSLCRCPDVEESLHRTSHAKCGTKSLHGVIYSASACAFRLD